MDGYIGVDRRSITHAGLDRLDISVKNLRKTKILNNSRLSRYSYHQLIKRESERLDKDDFIIKR